MGKVSTHSRPKAAGDAWRHMTAKPKQFQHTAARRRLGTGIKRCIGLVKVSTHSRPKAAGQAGRNRRKVPAVSTHSRPKAAGTKPTAAPTAATAFQHTAARRRLGNYILSPFRLSVSTHSRPKTAGAESGGVFVPVPVSTHSRPKAAGYCLKHSSFWLGVSTHSRPKAAG